MKKYVLVLLLFCAGCNVVNFKFVTSGQAVDDAQIITRIFDGRAMKPASPSDAKIFRDAQNNALVQWRRRGRINFHWRDRAGVPVSEESEYYEIEVLSGSTVIRTARIPLSESQPVQWGEIVQVAENATITIATDGTGTISHPLQTGGPQSFVYAQQILSGDFVFEFETYHNGTGLLQLPSQINIAPMSVSGASLGGYVPSGGAFTVNANGRVLSTTNITYAAGDRFVLEYIGKTMRWLKNPVTDDSPALLVEHSDLDFSPYRLQLSMTNPNFFETSPIGRGIRNPTLLRFTTPDWTYTAAMQTADGLTPGNPIHLKIYQVSAVLGRGIPLDVTL